MLRQAQQLRDHLVVPGPLDLEDHAAVPLRLHLLPRMKRLLGGPPRPGRVDSDAVASGSLGGAEDRHAVGEHRLDRLRRSLERPRRRLRLLDAIELEESDRVGVGGRPVPGRIGEPGGDVDAAVVDDDRLRVDRVALRRGACEAAVADAEREPVLDGAVDGAQRSRRILPLGRPRMDDEPLLVVVHVGEQFRRDELLDPRKQLAETVPVDGSRERSDEVSRDGEREQFGQRHGWGGELVGSPARLDRPAGRRPAAVRRLLHAFEGVAELLEKLEVAADVLVGHLVDHAPAAELRLQLGDRKRMPRAEEDVDEMKDPQKLFVPAE